MSGNSSTGRAPSSSARSTAPRAWRSLPSYGAWVELTPAEPCGRIGRRVPGTLPPARTGDRALVAARRRPAHRRAEVHQHLVPHPAVAARHERVGGGLDRPGGQPLAGRARQDPGDVRLDDGDVALEGEGEHGPRRVRTDAGQRQQRGQVVGHPPAVALDHRRGCVVQVAGPARVAEPVPLAEHVGE